MTKVAEAIVVITLLIFSFFIGVKYSDSVKGHAGWLFETKEEEVEFIISGGGIGRRFIPNNIEYYNENTFSGVGIL